MISRISHPWLAAKELESKRVVKTLKRSRMTMMTRLKIRKRGKTKADHVIRVNLKQVQRVAMHRCRPKAMT